MAWCFFFFKKGVVRRVLSWRCKGGEEVLIMALVGVVRRVVVMVVVKGVVRRACLILGGKGW